MRSIIGNWVVGIVFVGSVLPLQAGVIDAPDVLMGSKLYRTFIDDSTGLTWLDLDNFWGPTDTFNDVLTDMAGSGFHIATESDMLGLQASIPFGPSGDAWKQMASIVGGNYMGNTALGDDREIVWGVYDDGNGGYAGWSWLFPSRPWTTRPDMQDPDQPFVATNATYRDLGVWVVSDDVRAVPAPGAIFLFGLGLASLGWMRRN